MHGRGNAEDHEGDRSGDVRLEHRERRNAVDPHHRRRRVADDAARPARIRSGDDRGEKSDVHLVPIHDTGNRAADQRAAMLSRNDDSTKIITSRTNPPFQSSGSRREQPRGNVARLEMLRQQREPSSSPRRFASSTHSCRKRKIPPTRTCGGERREEDLEERDDRQSGHRDLQRVVMEQRDAEQRDGEQDEIDRDPRDRRGFLAHQWRHMLPPDEDLQIDGKTTRSIQAGTST